MPTAISEPANAATGTAEMPRNASDRLKVIARIAPSAAPVDTPSVNGVASGLRNRPWKTTPADAKSAPTHAPASVRGSRATKKICASTLSANGIEKSKTRRRLTDVGPTSGASSSVTAVSAPNPATVRRKRRCSVIARSRPPARCSGHDETVSGGVTDHVRFDAVDRADVRRRQDLVGRAARDDHAVADQQRACSQSVPASPRSCVEMTIATRRSSCSRFRSDATSSW